MKLPILLGVFIIASLLQLWKIHRQIAHLQNELTRQDAKMATMHGQINRLQGTVNTNNPSKKEWLLEKDFPLPVNWVNRDRSVVERRIQMKSVL